MIIFALIPLGILAVDYSGTYLSVLKLGLKLMIFIDYEPSAAYIDEYYPSYGSDEFDELADFAAETSQRLYKQNVFVIDLSYYVTISYIRLVFQPWQ